MWYVYLVRCKDNSLYCGITTDLKSRIKTHNAGQGAKYITSSRRPVTLRWSMEVEDRSIASRVECYIKSLEKRDKEKLASNEMIYHKIAGHDL